MIPNPTDTKINSRCFKDLNIERKNGQGGGEEKEKAAGRLKKD